MLDIRNDRGKTRPGAQMGRSGRAAVRLLLHAGAASIVLNDSKQADLLQRDRDLPLSRGAGCYRSTSGNAAGKISLIIKSPGIKPNLPCCRRPATADHRYF